jgi:hypothetical protein
MFSSDCRSCKHSFHGEFCAVAFIDYADITEPSYCDCSDYIPLDNLEYVEWCYIRSLRI